MSKLLIEIPPISDADCYYIQERFKPAFNYPMHKHNAFELNFVEHCKDARRIVGDSIEQLGDYDLALIGCNLEHVWDQHECTSISLHEITIQMPADLFSPELLNRRVMHPIRDLLENAQMGVAFGMRAIMTVYARLNQLASAEPSYTSLQTMQDILYDLAVSGDYHVLSSSNFSHAEVPVTSRRIQKIKEYIDAHYAEEIRIETLASLVNMTPTAFSRFFKQRTGRPVSTYITEVRIGHATVMLMENTMNILEISYKCGFNSISNFNRVFRENKNMTPKKFRESFKKNAFLI